MTWLYVPTRPPQPCDSPFLSICSGGGGLDVGVELAIPGARCVGRVEREAPACAALVAAMEAGVLAEAPLWSDAYTFDGRIWRGRVAGVAGGTPCQDMSLAGKRRGLNGSRSRLFFRFIEIIEAVEPEWVVWENVGGAASAIPAVCTEFEALGFRGAYVRVLARDVGATHERARWFLLAHHPRLHERAPHHAQRALARQRAWEDVGGGGVRRDAEPLAHRSGIGRGEGRAQPAWLGGGLDAAERGGAVGNGDDARLEGRILCRRGRADEQAAGPGGGACLPLWPPGPADVDAWRGVIGHNPYLAPAVYNGAAHLEPSIRRVVDGMALASGGLDRIELLRLLGNGVVPEQAAHAIRGLWRHLFDVNQRNEQPTRSTERT